MPALLIRISRDTLILNRLLNTVIRYIFSLRRDASLAQYYERLNWLSASARRLYFLGLTTYRIFTTNRPAYLVELLPPVGDIRRSARGQRSG